MPDTVSDKIEKHVVLKSSLDRVWQALTDSAQFGSWFGMKIDGPFVAGQTMQVSIKPTTVNEEIARHQKPYEGTPFEIVIDRIEPQTLFSFRWHPYAVDQNIDYGDEPMTLVTFTLKPVDGGVYLTVTESGFEKLTPERRAEAMPMNDGGWTAQMGLIEAYLAK